MTNKNIFLNCKKIIIKLKITKKISVFKCCAEMRKRIVIQIKMYIYMYCTKKKKKKRKR